jgi:hypothetical protein
MQTQNRKSTVQKFSDVLQKKLIERFGCIPSANRLANQFNLRAANTEPITQEAARRWIRGLSMPQVDRFQVLSAWLNISPHEFLEPGNTVVAPDLKPDKNNQENQLISMYRNLDIAEQHALRVAAQTLLHAKQSAG